MKTLLTNGCSWTYGGGLDFTEEQRERLPYLVWPYKLKELMQYDNCVNLAMGCGSNQRVVRTTFNWLQKQSKEILRNTTAVIQWTELSRYEYYYQTSDDPYEDLPENWALVKAGLVISKADPNNHNPDTLARSQRRYELLTDIEMLYTHIAELETLHSLFNEYGVRYYYWNFTHAYDLMKHPATKFILERYNWLDHGRHVWEYERLDNDPHPSETGHKQIAEHIYNAINNIDNHG